MEETNAQNISFIFHNHIFLRVTSRTESKFDWFQSNILFFTIKNIPHLWVLFPWFTISLTFRGFFRIWTMPLSYSYTLRIIFHPVWQQRTKGHLITWGCILFHLTICPFSPWSLQIIKRHIFMHCVDYLKGIPWCTPRKTKVYHFRKFIKMSSKSYIYIEEMN